MLTVRGCKWLIGLSLGGCAGGAQDPLIPAVSGDDTMTEYNAAPAPGTPPDPAVVAASALRGRLTRAGLAPLPPAPPVADALFDLGQVLAFDKELSGNRDVSCMTCHHPELGTDDDRSLSAGAGATGLGVDRTSEPQIARSAPPLVNLHLAPSMFWDGRVERRPDGSLVTPAGPQLTPAMQAVLQHGPAAAQAMFPVANAAEMRGQPGENELADLADDDFTGIWAALMDRLGAIPAYVALFEAAYPGQSFGDMSFAHAANAIAAFEIGAFQSNRSPFARFMAGDDTALTLTQQAGADAFVTGGCAACHRGPALSDFRSHDTALPQIGPGVGDGVGGLEDFGRFDVTGAGPDRYAFRTASLFQVADTGPWGHAGQFDDLQAFVGHYVRPDQALLNYDVTRHVADPDLWDQHVTSGDMAILGNLDPRLRGPRPPVDVVAVTTFLGTLTDPDLRDLGWTVPASVPSGAVVERP